ncbi:MAG: hypothetical protein KKE23_00585 [Nanoarchaeota archaeon]|nr:hypothetical protein [Nanoarchaeota archaeon]
MAESTIEYKEKTLPSGVKNIFECTGECYKVPGLYYEEGFKKIKMMVLDDTPSIQDLEHLLKQEDNKTLVSPWPIQVLRGYKNYLPSTFKRITANMSDEFSQKYFKTPTDWIPESKAILLQLQSELSCKSATIDAAIIHGRRDAGTVSSKVHNLNRLYNIGRMYEFVNEKQYPILFGDCTREEDWDEILFKTKHAFEEMMGEVPLGNRKYSRKMRKPEFSEKEVEKKFPFVNYLKNKLGDNLTGILLYGSSAREEDPSKYNDYDTYVVVRDMRKAFEAMKGTCPNVLDGKVKEMTGVSQDDLPKDAKHIGIHLIPNSADYIYRHMRMLHDSREFLLHTQVLYGEIPSEKSALDEVVQRGLSNAAIKSKIVIGALNWAYTKPEKIIGKPNLFDYIVKIPRFYLQHILNAEGKPKFRDKHQLNMILDQVYKMTTPEYSGNPEFIRESVRQAAANIFNLKKDFMTIEAESTPNFSFLTDSRIFGWKQGSEVDSWGRFDD